MSARVEVDLEALADNLRAIRDRVAPAAHMLVVKDDAYGHGLVPVVRQARAEGVGWFGAFDVETGIAVRAETADARIFSWLIASRAEAAAGIEAGLDLGVGDAELLEDVADAAATAGRPAQVHLKIDTGLHRNGIRPERWPQVVARAAELERRGLISVVGIWSHIGEASDADDDASRAVFDAAVADAHAAGLRPRVRHLSASAASFARPEFRYDLTRVGAFAYGIRSADGPAEESLGLRPVARVVAPVTSVSADGVTIGIGFLDGLVSGLAGRLEVVTPAGARILRAVEPDAATVAVWPGAAVGDDVVVLGAGATTFTTAAEQIATIGEEIAVRLSPRLPRRYASRA